MGEDLLLDFGDGAHATRQQVPTAGGGQGFSNLKGVHASVAGLPYVAILEGSTVNFYGGYALCDDL